MFSYIILLVSLTFSLSSISQTAESATESGRPHLRNFKVFLIDRFCTRGVGVSIVELTSICSVVDFNAMYEKLVSAFRVCEVNTPQVEIQLDTEKIITNYFLDRIDQIKVFVSKRL